MKKIKMTDIQKVKNILENKLNINEFISIFNSINNENYKYEILLKVYKNISLNCLKILLNNINSDKIKTKFLLNYYNNKSITSSYYDENFINIICCNIKSDVYKIMLISKINFKLYEIVKILFSLHNKKLIIPFCEDKKYEQIKKELIILTEDYSYIENYFNSLKKLDEKLAFINTVKNPNIKSVLINKIKNKSYRNFLNMSYEDTSFLINDTLVDKNITFGVEFELLNKNKKYFKMLTEVFDNFLFTYDDSIKNGFEIVSPVMKYCKNDMQRLFIICNSFKKNGFYTNKLCGGHIHIGADYLNSVDDYNNLLMLYCNIENILYAITNKSNMCVRKGYVNYAKPIYNKIVTNQEIIFRSENIKEYIHNLKNVLGTRFTSINFQNIGTKNKNTIELRMPNGEIEYNDLHANIVLFSKIIEVSHKLNCDDFFKKDYFYLLLNATDNDQKFYYLMHLLFDDFNDMKIYIDRYYTNFKDKNVYNLILKKS